jgi:hypothetical protein
MASLASRVIGQRAFPPTDESLTCFALCDGAGAAQPTATEASETESKKRRMATSVFEFDKT